MVLGNKSHIIPKHYPTDYLANTWGPGEATLTMEKFMDTTLNK